MLVWEPKRVVRTYAVAIEEVAGEIGAACRATRAMRRRLGWPRWGRAVAGRRVFDPSVPFAVRTTEGQSLMIRADREAAAFRPAGARP